MYTSVRNSKHSYWISPPHVSWDSEHMDSVTCHTVLWLAYSVALVFRIPRQTSTVSILYCMSNTRMLGIHTHTALQSMHWWWYRHCELRSTSVLTTPTFYLFHGFILQSWVHHRCLSCLPLKFSFFPPRPLFSSASLHLHVGSGHQDESQDACCS